MTVYEPMDITIVHDDHGGSWPEPELDQTWSSIDKLRWNAGVVKARTGITISLNDRASRSCAGRTWQWPELIGLNVGNTHTSVYADEAWTAINHIELGALAAQGARP